LVQDLPLVRYDGVSVKVLKQRLPLHDVTPFQRVVRVVVCISVFISWPEVLDFRDSILPHCTTVFSIVVVSFVVVVVVVVIVVVVMMMKATW